MSWSGARDALKIADVALQACETIEKLTGIGGSKTDAILATISAIIDQVKKGAAGEVSPEEASAAMKALTDKLAANDAAADEALHKKFDTTSG